MSSVNCSLSLNSDIFSFVCVLPEGMKMRGKNEYNGSAKANKVVRASANASQKLLYYSSPQGGSSDIIVGQFLSNNIKQHTLKTDNEVWETS